MASPCRSPYCECEIGKCTHPGFFDARGTKPVFAAKHIAHLQRRAAALEARMKAAPLQADFDNERGELKTLRWVIKLLIKLGEQDEPKRVSAQLPR